MKKRSIIQLARNVSAETSMANSSVMQILKPSIKKKSMLFEILLYLTALLTDLY